MIREQCEPRLLEHRVDSHSDPIAEFFLEGSCMNSRSLQTCCDSGATDADFRHSGRPLGLPIPSLDSDGLYCQPKVPGPQGTTAQRKHRHSRGRSINIIRTGPFEPEPTEDRLRGISRDHGKLEVQSVGFAAQNLLCGRKENYLKEQHSYALVTHD